MNSNRASGKDSILAEVFKAAGPNTLEAFHDVLQSIWIKEDMPETFTMLSSLLFKRTNRASPTAETTGASHSFL